MACKAGFKVPVYGFDNSKGVLYYGRIDKPKDTIPYGDKRLDEWIAMSLSNWEAVKIHCKVEK